MDNIIYYGIMLVIAVVTFLLGKYVFPKVKLDSTALTTLTDWVYKFVVSAKNQFEDGQGKEKLAYVTEQVKVLCDKYKINLTEEQIRALIEDAYDLMITNGIEALEGVTNNNDTKTVIK